MKKVGIWLDKRIAYIVTVDENKKDEIETVVSKAEDREEIQKAYRDKVKQGFSETIKDRKLLEYDKHELKLYFNDIIKQLGSTDAIVIYGPSQTAQKLSTELKLFHAGLFEKVKDVIKAKSMTKNQIRALIRDYYS